MSKRPNILFFFTDDQRHNTIRALGNTEIHTPVMDGLVQSGVTFTNAGIMGGTNPAVCMPSRAMLMSGRYLFRLEGCGETIPQAHKTLPEVLRQHGYWTHHIGKWHQDRESFKRSFVSADRIFGFTKGWYIQYGGHWNVAIHDFDPSGAYPEEDGYILAEDKETKLPIQAGVGGVHSSELFADAAIDFLGRHTSKEGDPENKPFLLYMSLVAPHDPRQSPDQFEEMYDAKSVSLPENFLPHHPFDNGEFRVRDEALEAWPRRPHAIRRHIADYYAMISHADAQIGRVIEALKKTGEYDNTLIVFAGDNGLAVGQHGLMGKQNLYEHSVRVPLIFSGPGVPANQRRSDLCYLLDIFPSLCEYLDLPVPDSVDGASLLPMIRNSESELRATQYHAYRNCQRAIRDARYKLIEYVVNGNRTTQLFNLEKDPLEMDNLAALPEHADRIAALRKELLKWREQTGDTRSRESAFWDGFNR